MKRKFFLLPFVALVLGLVSCNEPEFNSLVGCWSSKRFTPDMWTVYHLKADETGIVEYNTPDTCLTKEEFTWRTMDEELFLIYEGGATDSFLYSFDNSRLHLYDSENRHYGSYHKKRDCH